MEKYELMEEITKINVHKKSEIQIEQEYLNPKSNIVIIKIIKIKKYFKTIFLKYKFSILNRFEIYWIKNFIKWI